MKLTEINPNVDVQLQLLTGVKQRFEFNSLYGAVIIAYYDDRECICVFKHAHREFRIYYTIDCTQKV